MLLDKAAVINMSFLSRIFKIMIHQTPSTQKKNNDNNKIRFSHQLQKNDVIKVSFECF